MKANSSALSALSNNDLLAATRSLVGRSNEVTSDLIAHLAEVDSRKLYLEQAQPSLFAWCVAELGCSEDVACNWIAVARSSRRYPGVLDTLREGKVHLTGLRMLAPHLTGEGHRALLAEAAGKSKRDIEELIARIAPRPAVPTSIRKLPGPRSGGTRDGEGGKRNGLEAGGGSAGGSGADATPAWMAQFTSGVGAPGDLVPATNDDGLGFGGGLRAGADHASAAGTGGAGRHDGREARPASDTGPRPAGGACRPDSGDAAGLLGTAPATGRPALEASRRRGKVEPLSDEAYKVTFTASRRLRDKIRRARDLLGHQVQDGDLAEIVERGIDLLIEDTRKKRFAVGRKPRASKRDSRKMGVGEANHTPVAGQEAQVSWHRQANNTPAAGHEAHPSPHVQTAGSDAQRKERPSRHIPAEVRRAVIERDGEQCTFLDKRGRRCPERRRLELDHVEGFARVGRHTVEEIRLRCRSHNQWEAERMYGRSFMDRKRGAKASAPGRTKGGVYPAHSHCGRP